MLAPLTHYFASLIVTTITGNDMQVRNGQGTARSVQTKRGMVLPFQPLSLAFNHVNYHVDMPAVSQFFSGNIYIEVFFFIFKEQK